MRSKVPRFGGSPVAAHPPLPVPPRSTIIAAVKGAASRLPIAAGVFILAAIAAPACRVTTPGIGYLGGWDQDVSERSEVWGRYDPGAVYRIEHDLFLMELPEPTGRPALAAGMDVSVPPGTQRGPTTIDEYQADPRGWPGVRGVVQQGTRLRAFALRAKGNLRDLSATVHYVRARILNGPHQGLVVNMEPVSLYRADPETGRVILVGPNDEFLTRIT